MNILGQLLGVLDPKHMDNARIAFSGLMTCTYAGTLHKIQVLDMLDRAGTSLGFYQLPIGFDMWPEHLAGAPRVPETVLLMLSCERLLHCKLNSDFMSLQRELKSFIYAALSALS